MYNSIAFIKKRIYKCIIKDIYKAIIMFIKREWINNSIFFKNEYALFLICLKIYRSIFINFNTTQDIFIKSNTTQDIFIKSDIIQYNLIH